MVTCAIAAAVLGTVDKADDNSHSEHHRQLGVV